MKRGFVTFGIVITIIITATITAIVGYGIYKYFEIAEEKDSLEEQLNLKNDKSLFEKPEPVVSNGVDEINIKKQPEETKKETEIQDNSNTNSSSRTDYYYDGIERISNLITIYKEYLVWLQETRKQFWSATLSLSEKKTSGLNTELRDATIDLAKAEIKVIDSQMALTNESISYYEDALKKITSRPEPTFTEEMLNYFKDPEVLEKEIEGIIKKEINKDLDSVLNALKSLY